MKNITIMPFGFTAAAVAGALAHQERLGSKTERVPLSAEAETRVRESNEQSRETRQCRRARERRKAKMSATTYQLEAQGGGPTLRRTRRNRRWRGDGIDYFPQ